MDMFTKYSHAAQVANDFCDEFFTEKHVRQWVVSRGIPKYVHAAYFESELGEYCKPASLGGKKCPFGERIATIATLTRRAGATLPFLSDMLSMGLLSTMSKQSQDEIEEELMARAGRITFSQAFTEDGAGTEASAVRTTVTMDGGMFLDGCKTFVSGGQFASGVLVLARDPLFGREDGGLSLWLIPTSTLGISSYPINTLGQEMLSSARMVFDHVPLSPDWQIQSHGELSRMMKRQYEIGRVVICASSYGLALAAMDDALERCGTYMTKGQLLGALPQIQEKLADMEVKLRSMDALILDVCEEIDKGPEHDRLPCALMKRFVPTAATEIASEALQIFGGIGYTDNTRVGRIWCDCRGNQIAQGTDEIMVRQAAKLLLNRRARADA